MNKYFLTLVWALCGASSFSLYAQSPRLEPAFGETGLHSLKIDGDELLKNPSIRVSVNGKGLQDGSLEVKGSNTVLLTWPELQAQVTYEGSANSVSTTFHFKNTGTEPIREMTMAPFSIDFPSRPRGWFWGYSQKAEAGAPAVIAADWGTAKMVICAYEGPANPQAANNDQTIEILLKGPNSSSTIYPVSYQLTFPTPIKPNETGSFKGVIRVAPSGTPTPGMAADIYATFTQKFPFILKWPDRRPIGVIFLANSGKNWPTNPRGWFNDPKVDVTTEAGRADFRNRMMKLADTSISIMKDVGAQGMLFWDVEGGEMPHAITYLGDPRALPAHAPEMDEVADEFFKKFADAGFKTGVTIRPSRIVTRPSTGKPAHQQVEDPIADMSDKIAYAQKRWGSTIFYMDTNVTWPIDTRPLEEDLTRGMWQGNASLISTSDMVDLAKRHPDNLIFPEFPRFGYYSAVGIYGETRTGGRLQTPSDVRAVYPDAVTVWKLGDVDFQIEWDGLLQASMDGDIQVFRAWFGDWANAFVKLLQEEKAFRQDLRSVRLQGTFGQQLTHGEALVRYAAVMTLAKPNAEQVKDLINALQSEKDWVIRRRMILALGASGLADGIPLLERLAQESSDRLDYVAMVSLGNLGGGGTRILVDIVNNKKGRPREYALRALGLNTDPVATPILTEVALGANEKDASLAIGALIGRHTPELEAQMIGLLDSDQPARLIAAAEILGEFKSQAAVEPLVALIDRAVSVLKNNKVRVATGIALEKITDARYGPYSNGWKRALDNGELSK